MNIDLNVPFDLANLLNSAVANIPPVKRCTIEFSDVRSVTHGVSPRPDPVHESSSLATVSYTHER